MPHKQEKKKQELIKTFQNLFLCSKIDKRAKQNYILHRDFCPRIPLRVIRFDF